MIVSAKLYNTTKSTRKKNSLSSCPNTHTIVSTILRLSTLFSCCKQIIIPILQLFYSTSRSSCLINDSRATITCITTTKIYFSVEYVYIKLKLMTRLDSNHDSCCTHIHIQTAPFIVVVFIQTNPPLFIHWSLLTKTELNSLLDFLLPEEQKWIEIYVFVHTLLYTYDYILFFCKWIPLSLSLIHCHSDFCSTVKF